jgi:hypothetical protein
MQQLPVGMPAPAVCNEYEPSDSLAADWLPGELRHTTVKIRVTNSTAASSRRDALLQVNIEDRIFLKRLASSQQRFCNW